eukprot:3042572-Amphidinium_carterae.1
MAQRSIPIPVPTGAKDRGCANLARNGICAQQRQLHINFVPGAMLRLLNSSRCSQLLQCCDGFASLRDKALCFVKLTLAGKGQAEGTAEQTNQHLQSLGGGMGHIMCASD